MAPHFEHSIRDPNSGTGISSGQGSALKIAAWWHFGQVTASERAPFARMLPSVIGSPAGDGGRLLMPPRISFRLGGRKARCFCGAGSSILRNRPVRPVVIVPIIPRITGMAIPAADAEQVGKRGATRRCQLKV
jgi:hypothetical protein